ncbi:MAG: hypothetical protein RRY23_00090 [Alistipes sp.]
MDLKQFLSNTQMGKLVANFMKKELPTNDQGKVVFSAEEEQQLTQRFGAPFVEKLKDKTFSSANDNSTELFDAAVAHARHEVEALLTPQIKQLQADLATMGTIPEPAPGSEAGLDAAHRVVKRAGTFKANMAMAHNQDATAFLQSGVMATNPTIEVTDLQSELGPYLSQGNNLDVLQQLYQGFTTSKYLNWKRAMTKYVAVESEATEHIIQQFKKGWSPKGGAKFVPLEITNYRHKIDFAIDPTEVGESWMYHLYDESQTPDQMPITRYIIDKVLLPKIAEDMEFITGKAKYVKGSDKTEETMEGIETQLVAAKRSLDKNISFFANAKNLLEATDAEVLVIIDDFVASIAPLYKSIQMPVFLSADVYLKYKRAYKVKWGEKSGTEKINFGVDRVDFSNCYLQVLDCLHGSPIVFSTPPLNFIGLRHKNPAPFITDIQKHDREVRIYMEFWYGVGFLFGEAVFAIVPDGYDPNTVVTSTRQGTPGKWIVTAEDKPEPAPAGNHESI